MNLKRLVLGELETNCYLIWAENGVGIIVDPADEADRILDEASSLGLSIVAVVLTHVHFDHMLAAEAVCRETGAHLYVGAGDEDALGDPIRNLSGWFSPENKVTLPTDRLLHEGDVLTFGEESFSVLETPGHTPGCICLLSGNTLISGDTLFRNSIGRLDFPGGDTNAMIASLKRLIALPEDTQVYSGHGPSTTIGCEIKRNPYLQ